MTFFVDGAHKTHVRIHKAARANNMALSVSCCTACLVGCAVTAWLLKKLSLLPRCRCDALIRTCTGDALIRTCTGDALIRTCTGDALIRTCTGDALIRTCTGDALIRTCRGDALIRTCRGDALIRTCGCSTSPSNSYLYEERALQLFPCIVCIRTDEIMSLARTGQSIIG